MRDVVELPQGYEACCPHPRCQGTMKLAQDLPPGVYQCICHACDVRWDGAALTLVTAHVEVEAT